MLKPGSRYQALSVKPNAYTDANGRTILYLPRRFLPASASTSMPAQVLATSMERLDQLAARTLGDPEQFWRLCDANDAMNPFDLIHDSDGRLRLPAPYGSAQWSSTLAAGRDALQPLLALPPGQTRIPGTLR
jgi:hypothetical protein